MQKIMKGILAGIEYLKKRIKNLIASILTPQTINRIYRLKNGFAKGFNIQTTLGFLRTGVMLRYKNSLEELFLLDLDL